MQNKLELNKKKILFLWLFNILGIIISCYMTYYKGKVTGTLDFSKSQVFHSSFVLINCICMLGSGI